MRQVRFWAIAPIALLATFSGKPAADSPVSDPGGVFSNRSSTLVRTEFSQNSSDAVGAVNRVLAQQTPGPSPSPESSPAMTRPTSPRPDAGSSKIILEQKGELTPANSSVLPSDGSLFDQYTFEGNQGQTVVVVLESTDFDTYLAILNSEGEAIGENDNVAEQNSNSEITVTLPASGRYRIFVNASEPPPKGRGKYSLTVRETVKN